MKLKYFAYGSNLDQKAMKKRCPDSTPLQPGVLKGYSLGFTYDSAGWVGGVADIMENPHEEVWGLLYEISERNLEKLDEYEGYPMAYTRFTTSIQTSSGMIENVWVYEVVQKRGFVAPTKEYLDIIKKAGKEFNFPEHYRKKLDKVETR
ncbi:MAG TPA: gamma-glutamylcyclotransferase family protein [Nitrospiria bacterium]|jgi:gamma-glutamylcyclotransferase (GGCT)/AIG2-like uncharacterized protein YtfP